MEAPFRAGEGWYHRRLACDYGRHSRDGCATGRRRGKTGHLIPLVKVSDAFHYRLKPSDRADASVKAMLDEKLSKGTCQFTGEDIIRGSAYGAGLTGGWRWALVYSIAPK